jgi:hypothetical protein
MGTGLRSSIFAALMCAAPWFGAASIAYTATPLGGATWRYDYVVGNDAASGDIEEFTIYFAPGAYSNLVSAATAGWDILVIQPDAQIPADGFYDGLSVGPAIAPGTSSAGFSVTFTFLGSGIPGPQPFEIVDPLTFVPLFAGSTVAGSDPARKIAALYVGFFERAADSDGNAFWRGVAQGSGLSDGALMRLMAAGFAGHPSFAAIYGALSDDAYVDAIYLNIGGKVADAAGRAYWLGRLATDLSRSSFVADFLFYLLELTEADLQDMYHRGQITLAELEDALARKARMTHKSTVALAFLSALGPATNLLPGTDPLDPISLEADPAYRASKNIIRAVTENAATLAAPMGYLGGSPTIDGINTTFGP